MCFLWFLITEKYHSVELSAKRGCPSAKHSPSRLSERHFLDYIPPNREETNPTRQCIICYSKRDSKKKSRTKIEELISYGWTTGLQWVPSHVWIPDYERADQNATQEAETTQSVVLLTLRRAKSIISSYIDKYTAKTQKMSSGKPW
ncbi:hypothetical protein TNCV_72431 [Trichonephila clavipes]|uniref:Uncharacterized protein n=1 Tax=Trichonephila clavipes TaxID=2585209 RepID=A0A8X6RFM6_TRICX|nr:hypothetical protein TNCV_72431 [Trichonephila clavipes]